MPCKCTFKEPGTLSTAKTWAGPRALAGQLARAAQPTATATGSSASPAAPSLYSLSSRTPWVLVSSLLASASKTHWKCFTMDEFVVQAGHISPFWFYSTESYFACAVVDLLNCVRVPLDFPVLGKLASEKWTWTKKEKAVLKSRTAVNFPSARGEQDSIFNTDSKMKLQLNSSVLILQQQIFFDSALHTKSPHGNEMGTPTHPTFLPWCPGFPTLDTYVAVSYRLLFGQSLFTLPSQALWSFPQEYKPIKNLNYTAHISSVWTDPSVFSTGGLSFQSWGNLPKQPLPQN